MTEGPGFSHGVRTCCPWPGPTCLQPGEACLPRSPGPPAALATLSSGSAAQDSLPHPRVLSAQGLAPESFGPPHTVPASAQPLFLPQELGGPWRLTSLHRKRNRSCHLPLSMTSPMTWPSSPGGLRLLLKPVSHAPSWGLWLPGPLVFPYKYWRLDPCLLFFLTSCPPGLLPAKTDSPAYSKPFCF